MRATGGEHPLAQPLSEPRGEGCPSNPDNPDNPDRQDSASVDAWDSDCAAIIIAKVDALIDAAIAPGGIANTPARRQLLEIDRQLIRRYDRERDPLLWSWFEPGRGTAGLIARWQ
jgi:hypothetical protein